MDLIKPRGAGDDEKSQDLIEGTMCPLRSKLVTIQVPVQTPVGVQVDVQCRTVNVACSRLCQLWTEEHDNPKGRCGLRAVVMIP